MVVCDVQTYTFWLKYSIEIKNIPKQASIRYLNIIKTLSSLTPMCNIVLT